MQVAAAEEFDRLSWETDKDGEKDLSDRDFSDKEEEEEFYDSAQDEITYDKFGKPKESLISEKFSLKPTKTCKKVSKCKGIDRMYVQSL